MQHAGGRGAAHGERGEQAAAWHVPELRAAIQQPDGGACGIGGEGDGGGGRRVRRLQRGEAVEWAGRGLDRAVTRRHGSGGGRGGGAVWRGTGGEAAAGVVGAAARWVAESLVGDVEALHALQAAAAG